MFRGFPKQTSELIMVKRLPKKDIENFSFFTCDIET